MGYCFERIGECQAKNGTYFLTVSIWNDHSWFLSHAIAISQIFFMIRERSHCLTTSNPKGSYKCHAGLSRETLKETKGATSGGT